MTDETRRMIAALRLEPLPHEGGFFRQTWRDAAGSAIYFLLTKPDFSALHRLRTSEVWHFYAGAPLVLTMSPNGHDAAAHRLGPDLARGERPQLVVPAGWWQTATSLGAWTLVGCTVAPGFRFEGFELAPPGWRPTPRPAAGDRA